MWGEVKNEVGGREGGMMHAQNAVWGLVGFCTLAHLGKIKRISGPGSLAAVCHGSHASFEALTKSRCKLSHGAFRLAPFVAKEIIAAKVQ